MLSSKLPRVDEVAVLLASDLVRQALVEGHAEAVVGAVRLEARLEAVEVGAGIIDGACTAGVEGGGGGVEGGGGRVV